MWLAVLALLSFRAGAQPGTGKPEAVQAGERSFQQLCSGCHGVRGEGGQGEGQGPNLVNSWEVRRASDARLAGSIRNGVPGTAMPPFSLPAERIAELASFVRSLNSPAINVPIQGNPNSGEAIFTGKGGCLNCHMLNGRGGYLGPDLSDAGVTKRVDELRRAILNPIPKAGNGYRPVLLDTGSGSVKGIVRPFSNWSMQVLDENGRLHLLNGRDLKKATLQSKSWMPDDYGRRLTTEDLNNLIAFLSRQTVRPPSRSGVDPTVVSPGAI